jgi:AcrR family transcriptional regulator
VEQQQRERILPAMIAVVAEKGYADSRIVDVVEEAGVSRKTFYELFEDKEACFLEAYERIVGMLLQVTTEAYDAHAGAWAQRMRAGMSSFLAIMAEYPHAAKFCIVEVLAAGPRALRRRDAALREFTHFLDEGRAETGIELPEMTAVGLAGGVYEMLYSEILHGATAGLPDRLPDVIYWLTQPYLGDSGAAAQRVLARTERARVKELGVDLIASGNGYPVVEDRQAELPGTG